MCLAMHPAKIQPPRTQEEYRRLEEEKKRCQEEEAQQFVHDYLGSIGPLFAAAKVKESKRLCVQEDYDGVT